MNDSKPPIRATALKDCSGRVRQQFGEERICLDDECSTILSIYNRDPRCAIHQLRRISAIPLGRRY